jgi:hypothetical protein
VPRHGGLGFGNPQRYKVVPFCAAVHVAKFAQLSKMHHAMVGVDTPRSLDDWVTGLTRVTNQIIRDNKSKKSARSYGFLWMYRSYMYAEMRAAGIKRLSVSGKNTVGDLMKGFPDQCNWMHRFVDHNSRNTKKSTKVSTMLKQLKYKDPVENLTMDLCVLGSIRKWSSEDIGSVQAQLKKKRIEMDKPGRPAHPAVILDLVMSEVRSGAD